MMTVTHTVHVHAAGQEWEIALTAGPAPDWNGDTSAELHTQLGAPEWIRAAAETTAGEPDAVARPDVVARAVAHSWPAHLPPLTQITVSNTDDTSDTSATWSA